MGPIGPTSVHDGISNPFVYSRPSYDINVFNNVRKNTVIPVVFTHSYYRVPKAMYRRATEPPSERLVDNLLDLTLRSVLVQSWKIEL